MLPPPSIAASISLRISDLDGGTRDLLHPGAKLQIGSHPDSGLVLSGRGVAGYHCVLETTPTGYVLRDRGSRTGTFVNNERLTEPRELATGDRIYIGEYQLELTSPPPAAARVARKPASIVTRMPPPGASPIATPSRVLPAAVLVALVAGGTWALWPAAAPVTPITATAARIAAGATRPAPTPAPARPRTTVHHEVIPGETIADIAARYGVSATQLIADHDLNPDQPPPPGTELVFAAIVVIGVTGGAAGHSAQVPPVVATRVMSTAAGSTRERGAIAGGGGGIRVTIEAGLRATRAAGGGLRSSSTTSPM